MRIGMLWLLFIALNAVSLRADDLYVSNTQGDDLNTGAENMPRGDRRGPFRTIAHALRVAASGDRIIIENTGEPYRESITLQAEHHSGISRSPFVIEGNGAILDGTEPVPPDGWESYEGDIYRFAAERKSSHVLYLQGRPAKHRLLPSETEGIAKLEPLEWCLHEGHVYFRTEPFKLPWTYELTHTVLPVGITLYEVHDVVIRDLIVQGFALDGVNAHDGAVATELVGLTCRGNGRSGISVGGASRVTIEACLVGDNLRSQVRTEGYCEARIVNCDLIDNPQSPALDKQGGEVSIEKPRVVRATVTDEELR